MVEPLLLSRVYRGVRDVGDQDQTPSDPGTQKPRIGIMICQTRTNSCKSRRNSGKNRIFTPEKNTANSTVPAVDLLPDWLLHGSLHCGGKRRAVFGVVDPGSWTCDPAYRFLRRRSFREPGAGREKCAKNAALLHTFLRCARYAAQLPKYAKIVAL